MESHLSIIQMEQLNYTMENRVYESEVSLENLRASRSKITIIKRIRIMKGDEVRVHKKEFLTPSNL